MDDFLTINSVLQLATLVGIIFAVYKSYSNPQARTNKEVVLMQKDIETIATRLGELEMNHIHTLTENTKENRKKIDTLIVTVEKLSTIIDERIPKTN